jgi:hypothetical protein
MNELERIHGWCACGHDANLHIRRADGTCDWLSSTTIGDRTVHKTCPCSALHLEHVEVSLIG